MRDVSDMKVQSGRRCETGHNIRTRQEVSGISRQQRQLLTAAPLSFLFHRFLRTDLVVAHVCVHFEQQQLYILCKISKSCIACPQLSKRPLRRRSSIIHWCLLSPLKDTALSNLGRLKVIAPLANSVSIDFGLRGQAPTSKPPSVLSH